MRECDHISYWPVKRKDGWSITETETSTWTVTDDRDPDARLCDKCGAWLPIGPAAPHTEQTRIELRAAELVVMRPGAFVSNEAHAGYWAHERGWDPAPTIDGQAGWLAREIFKHDKEQS